jgi:hypothetical protein
MLGAVLLRQHLHFPPHHVEKSRSLLTLQEDILLGSKCELLYAGAQLFDTLLREVLADDTGLLEHRIVEIDVQLLLELLGQLTYQQLALSVPIGLDLEEILEIFPNLIRLVMRHGYLQL